MTWHIINHLLCLTSDIAVVETGYTDQLTPSGTVWPVYSMFPQTFPSEYLDIVTYIWADAQHFLHECKCAQRKFRSACAFEQGSMGSYESKLFSGGQRVFSGCTWNLVRNSLAQIYHLNSIKLFEPSHDKTYKMSCAPSVGSDQSGHPPSLISLRCALNG